MQRVLKVSFLEASIPWLALAGLALLASGCTHNYGPVQNGLDHNLSFAADGSAAAVGSTVTVGVTRDNGSKETGCVALKNETCSGGEHFTTAIDLLEATCGDGCTADIAATNDSVSVRSNAPGTAILTVRARARGGVEEWRDRYALEFRTATQLLLRVRSPGDLHSAYGVDVGATVGFRMCFSEGAAGACLGGHPEGLTFTSTHPSAEVSTCPTAPVGSPSSGCDLQVRAASGGSATIEIAALGLSKSFTFRSVDPSEWVGIEFEDSGPTPDSSDDVDARPALVAASHDISLNPYGRAELGAAARLADGSLALVSASRVVCRSTSGAELSANLTPTTASRWSFTAGLKQPAAKVAADGFCAIAGYESLGSVLLHVR
jgi:hypothetical protein